MRKRFPAPVFRSNLLRFGQPLGITIVHASDVKIARAGHPAQRCPLRVSPSAGAVNDPFEDPHVLAETRPEKLALLIAPSESTPCG